MGKKKTVAISGGFDPIHIGHIRTNGLEEKKVTALCLSIREKK
jgi:nicotinic acid mononucleotide adenylyltransferase